MIEELLLDSTTCRPPLRVGVILDDFHLAPPGFDILSQVRRCNFAELVLVALEVGSDVATPDRAVRAVGKGGNAPRSSSRALFHWYRRWDRARIAKESEILSRRDCGSLLAGVPVVRLERAMDGDAASKVIGHIRDCRLDVLVHLGSVPVRGAILEAARFGVWSLQWGDDAFSADPPYFREMVERRELASVSLRIVSEPPDPQRILASAHARTESFASLARNSFAPVAGARTLVIEKLHQLHRFGWPQVERGIRTVDSIRSRNDHGASNGEMLRFLSTQLFRQARLRAQLANTLEHWQVALRSVPGAATSRDYGDGSGYKGLDAPHGHYYADPFVFENEGRRYVFVEDFSYVEDKGRIACIEIDRNGSPGEPVCIIERPYHCSYPQVIRDGGRIFIVPETGFNQSVEIYAAVRFPYEWRLERQLFHGSAFDTTVVRHDGLFWFFVTLVDHVEYYCPQLFLFYAKSLTGEWTLHPESPISRDIRTARCGGSILHEGEKLVRVAQDGSVTYGHGLRFLEIVTLNTAAYEEREVRALACSAFPGSIGVHTYNRCGDLEAIDIKRRVPRTVHLPRG